MNIPIEAPKALDERTYKIRALNDQLRTTFSDGQLFLTPGIRAFGDEGVTAVLQAVRTFDAFTPDNDPYGEADFGSFQYLDQTIYWKVDYYDNDLIYGSPDPTDPDVTTRVLTVLLASEY